jgi:glucose/mannose-6-phosphate isomerase
MEKLIQEFPAQLRESVEIAQKVNLQIPSKKFSNIVVCGLGGSGIGARIVSQWLEEELQIPFTIVQNYTIPKFIDANTLVIGSSYSGNTEETISAVTACKERGAEIVGISSGGTLMAFCANNNFNFIQVPGGLPPRAALGYSIVQLVKVLESYKLISSECFNEFLPTAAFLEAHTSEIQEIAREMVNIINNTTNVLYAEAPYESVALRGKQQFNENGKFLCRYHVIPEMNHNELLGWGSGSQNDSVIFLQTEDMHPSNKKRFELTREIVSKKTDKVISVHAKGSNKMERSMYLIYVLDWASNYLGLARNEDVTEIRTIDYLKGELAKHA